MQTILVTGANGQLGNEMRLISEKSLNKYIFTDIQELDITSLQEIKMLLQQEKVNVVINCAAYTNVEKAEDNFEAADLINNKAVANLAVACKENDATLIHVSTDYVFSGDENTPYREDHPTKPLGIYGRTKLAGEQALFQSGCNYLIFRTAWLYSSFGNNFVKTMRRLTSEKESVNVVFDQIGSPTYAADLAAIIYKVVEEELYRTNSGIYHVTNEGVCSWYDFAIAIAELSGNRCNIQPCHSDEFPSKVKRPNYSVLDKTKVKTTFQVTIPHWMDGLRRCIALLG